MGDVIFMRDYDRKTHKPKTDPTEPQIFYVADHVEIIGQIFDFAELVQVVEPPSDVNFH